MKIIADKVTQINFEVKCPRCGTVHSFTKVLKNQYYLGTDHSDTFHIDDIGHVWPMFVCRNEKCIFEDKLFIVNLIL